MCESIDHHQTSASRVLVQMENLNPFIIHNMNHIGVDDSRQDITVSDYCKGLVLPLTPGSIAGTDNNIVSSPPSSTMSSPVSPSAAMSPSSSAMSISSSTPSSSPSVDEKADYDPSFHRIHDMLATESSVHYHVQPDYLHSSALLLASANNTIAPLRQSGDQGVTERCRRRTCEWMYDICDYFRLNREVVGIALFYVDRYFTITFNGVGDDVRVPVTRRKFQLVALTGLYVAVKLHGESRQDPIGRRLPFGNPNPTETTTATEGGSSTTIEEEEVVDRQVWNRVKFSLAICASISRNQFEPDEIEECERDLLTTLDWHVNPVVSSGSIIDSLLVYLPRSFNSVSSSVRPSNIATYGRSVSITAEPSPTSTSIASFPNSSGDNTMIAVEDGLSIYVYDCAKYLCELSVSIPALCLVYRPSVVAYASIIYAISSLHRSAPSIRGSGVADPTSLSILLPQQMSRWKFEANILSATATHFETERENVASAGQILREVCPNLGDLFHIPNLIEFLSPASTIINQ